MHSWIRRKEFYADMDWLMTCSSARIGAAAGGQSLDRALQSPAVVMAAARTREAENHRELSVHVRQHPEFFCKNPKPATTYPPLQDHPQQLNGDSKQLGSSLPSTSSPSSTPALLEAKHPIPVKLFGVPLHSQSNNNSEEPGVTQCELPVAAGTKRRQPDSPWEVVSELHPHDRVFLRPPPRKCLQGSSEMGSELSRPASVQAPWMQICATRDEGVYIWDDSQLFINFSRENKKQSSNDNQLWVYNPWMPLLNYIVIEPLSLISHEATKSVRQCHINQY